MYLYSVYSLDYLVWTMTLPHGLYLRFVLLLLHAPVILRVAARRFRDNSPPPPRFMDTPVNVTFTKGEEAILQCSIENLGARVVVWRRASEPNPLTIGVMPYIENPRIGVTHDKTREHWKLHIKNVQPRHAGVYECQISSKLNLIRLIMMRVNDSPNPIKPSVHITGTKVVDVGQPIKLQCNVTGWAESLQEVDWFKDGDKISPNFENKISISKFEVTGTNTYSSYLEIEHSTKSDSGTYLCRSTDREVARMYVDVLNTASINKKRGGSEKASIKSAANDIWKCTEKELALLPIIIWILNQFSCS